MSVCNVARRNARYAMFYDTVLSAGCFGNWRYSSNKLFTAVTNGRAVNI